MFSQKKLLEAIAEDLKVCKQAEATTNPADVEARNRAVLEYDTLNEHLKVAMAAGDDQAALERVIRSLENNLVVRRPHWRELSTV